MWSKSHPAARFSGSRLLVPHPWQPAEVIVLCPHRGLLPPGSCVNKAVCHSDRLSRSPAVSVPPQYEAFADGAGNNNLEHRRDCDLFHIDLQFVKRTADRSFSVKPERILAVGAGIGVAIGIGTRNHQATGLTIQASSRSISLAMPTPIPMPTWRNYLGSWIVRT